ncbi:hypothetical protein SCRDD08_01471 [Streptococcus cristatus]|uniref:Uncharacterized protein n=1 Tax=Streptococcus cristatus TaxID=45634 RepID=A0A139MZG7_STRCR|nr:hypothetical protein SCRDD08_01471 [Streptococcus cristatus]
MELKVDLAWMVEMELKVDLAWMVEMDLVPLVGLDDFLE